MSEAFLKFARWSTSRGINIVPGFGGEKFSRLKDWPTLATTNDMRLREWAQNDDYVNPIAVAKTGETISVDIDDSNMVAKLPPIPDTVIVDTPSGGLHVHFNWTPEAGELGNCNIVRVGEYCIPDKDGNLTTLAELKVHNLTVAAPGAVNKDGAGYIPRKLNGSYPKALADIPHEWVEFFKEHRQVSLPRSAGSHRKIHPDFESMDWFEWYEDLNAFQINDPVEKNGFTLYTVTVGCLFKGEKHRQSNADGFRVYPDGGMDWSCFATSCGWGYPNATLEQVMDHLEEEGFERFPYHIYEDTDDELLLEDVDIDELDDEEAPTPVVVESIAVEPEEPEEEMPTAKHQEVKGDVAEAIVEEEPMKQPIEVEPVEPTKLKDGAIDMLAETVLNILLRDPEGIFSNFALYRTRFEARAVEIEYPPLNNTIRMLLAYVRELKKLPNDDELCDFITYHSACKEYAGKSEVIAYLGRRVDKDQGYTLDTTMQRFIEVVDLVTEMRVWKSGFGLMKEKKDIKGARTLLREQWSKAAAISGDHGYKPGAIQDPEHIQALKDSFARYCEGTDDGRRFITGFPSIDSSTLRLGLDNEHAIVIYGPSNNAKTSFTLSLAYNFAKQGKHGIIFVGEHQAETVEESLAMLHSQLPKFRTRFTIPPIARFQSADKRLKPTAQDLANMHEVLTDLGSMQTLPGYLEVKNINSIGGTLDSIHSYMEASHKKYNWDFMVIDPFDSIVSEESKADQNNGWADSKVAVNDLFDYTRDYQGGRGILAIVTAQILSRPAREIEKIQSDGESEGEEGDVMELKSVLRQDKQIQLFTTISQRFDAALGVCLTKKHGREGLLVQGRTRQGADFDWLRFSLDSNSWYAAEVQSDFLRRGMSKSELVGDNFPVDLE
jgi:hypothetical protein